MTFTLLTMGINLLLFAGFSRIAEKYQKFFQPLLVYGAVPLFFYLLHLFIYAGFGLWLVPDGTSIPAMIPYWLLGLLILYPLCWWYRGFKQKRGAGTLLRFL
jgi:hypothetical protein